MERIFHGTNLLQIFHGGEALALGARAFFGKPFDHHALVAALRRMTKPAAGMEGVAS